MSSAASVVMNGADVTGIHDGEQFFSDLLSSLTQTPPESVQ